MSIRIKDIPRVLDQAGIAGFTPLFTGAPGTAKTSSIQQYCVDNDLGYYAFVASQRNQPDVVGFPVPQKREIDGRERLVTTFTMSPLLSIIHRMMDEGHDKGIINIDEIMSADTLLKKALSSMISDRMIDGIRLPEGWRFAATGNRMQDRAGVTSTPMQLLNRCSVIEVEPDYESWRDGYAVQHNVHPLYMSAMQVHESSFISREVPSTATPYSTLRTFTLAHDAHMSIANATADTLELPLDDVTSEVIGGLIGSASASVLFDHLKNHKHLPTRSAILADPKTAKLPPPTELGAVYTVTELLLQMATMKNIDTLWQYAERLDNEILMGLATRMTSQSPAYLNSQVFGKWVEDNGAFVSAAIAD